MPYYLGIDGGGTKTTCAVGDDSHLIATATTGPSNIVRVGEAQARESLQQSVRQACAAAGITPAEVSCTCVGGSGAARPELAAIVRDSLAEILATPIDVVGDMQIALEAAFDTGPGVIVIAGTGSIAYGRDAQGTTARAGGWGFAIGDEGSAHWIGRAAVSAVLRASDPRDGTPQRDAPRESSLSLSAALLKAWGVTSLTDLAGAANSVPLSRLRLAVSVSGCQPRRTGYAGAPQCGQGTRFCGLRRNLPPLREGPRRFRPGGHDGRRLSSRGAGAPGFLQ